MGRLGIIDVVTLTESQTSFRSDRLARRWDVTVCYRNDLDPILYQGVLDVTLAEIMRKT